MRASGGRRVDGHKGRDASVVLSATLYINREYRARRPIVFLAYRVWIARDPKRLHGVIEGRVEFVKHRAERLLDRAWVCDL